MNQSDNFEANREEKRKLAEHNTAVVGAILLEHGFDGYSVEFDGQSDSGEIVDITFLLGDSSVKVDDSLLSMPVTGFQKVVLSGRGVLSRVADDDPRTLEDAVGDCAMDAVAVDHAGWENGAGGMGTVLVRADRISVEMGLREVKYEEREFVARPVPLDDKDALPSPSPLEC